MCKAAVKYYFEHFSLMSAQTLHRDYRVDFGTFGVDKQSPAELEHIADVTGKPPAKPAREHTLS